MKEDPPRPSETPASGPTFPDARSGRNSAEVAIPAGAPPGPAPSPRRPRRRGLGWAIIRAGLLAGLVGLTYANGTWSRALDEARVAEARGDFLGAIKAATEHLHRRPWGDEARRVAARCLSRLDHAGEAEAYYRRSWGLTVADLRYRAYGLTRANLRDRALEKFDDVLRRQPDDLSALRLKVGLLLSMNRWEEVAEIGRRLAQAPPGRVRFDAPVASADHWTFKPTEILSVAALGYTLLAIADHGRGEVEAAVASYQKVLAIDPDLRSMPLDRRLFWAQFGEDLLMLGRSPDVIRYLTAADGSQAEPALVALRARAYAQQDSADEAETCWRRVLELSPDHPEAWLNLGLLELRRGHLEEAARLLARAATLAPGSYDAAYNLGITYQRLRRSADAKRWEEVAARLRGRGEGGAPGPAGATSIRPESPAGRPAGTARPPSPAS